VFLAGAGSLVAFYLWGLLGLPGFGNYPGPYGFVINRIAVPKPRPPASSPPSTSTVAASTPWRRSFILLTAAAGVSIVLRRLRDERERSAVDGLTAPIQRFQSGVINDYVTWIVLGLAVIGGVLRLIIR